MATESPYPSIEVPEVDIWAFLFERQTDFPADKVIFVDNPTSRQYTFRDVKETTIAFGHALRTKWSWQKGDVLGLYAPNCVDMPALMWGTLWAGGVLSPANPAYTATELAFQLKDSEAKAILTQVSHFKIATEAAKIAGIPDDRVLLMGHEKNAAAQYFTDFIESAKGKPVVKRVIQTPNDVAYIPYSSGTTGLPKGVILTQGNIVSNTLMCRVGISELSSDDTMLAVLPFYHAYGVAILIHQSIFIGMKAVILPQFDLEIFCRAIQTHKITYAAIVPPILLGLCKSPIVDKYDLSSIRCFMSAAAPLTPELVKEAYKRLKIPVKQAYGLTETSPGTHIQEFALWQSTIGSVGKLLPNQTAKYVDPDTGRVLPAGEIGELWVHGPNIFAGYHNNPTATANCMTADNYFRTGDIGYQDAEGNFYITDRLKELIKYKGFQVAPAELEGLLVGNEMVADACVVGVYDEARETEVPMAFVVKAEKVKDVRDEVVEKGIKEWVDVRVAGHKRLRGGVRFVDAIPKSAAGKILRRVLRDKVKAEKIQKGPSKAKL